ncbi:MAG: hypothetical protein ACI4I3_07275 [Acutalibacteraceae bacterium]
MTIIIAPQKLINSLRAMAQLSRLQPRSVLLSIRSEVARPEK